jgi:hypothetical protein
MSKAPVAWRAYREFLFDRVSWPNRCRAVDRVIRFSLDDIFAGTNLPRGFRKRFCEVRGETVAAILLNGDGGKSRG